MNLPWTNNKELLIELAKLRERNIELEALATEQRLDHEELERINTLLRKVFETVPDLFAIIDKNHHILLSNWHGGYGYVPEALRSGNPICYETFYGRQAPCEPCHCLEVFSSNEPVFREKINPKIGWVKIHAYPIPDDSGKTTMVVEHIRDITEKKQAQMDLQRYRDHLVEMVDERTSELNQANKDLTRENSERREAEEALRASEEKFRAVAETSPAAIFLYQGEKFIYVNPSAERLTGYSQDEFLAMRFWDWIHPDFMELVKTRGLARQRGVSLPPEYEFCFLTNAGEEKWGILSAKCIEFAGKPTGIASFVDITDRKLAEEKLRDSEEQFRVMTSSAQDAIIMMDNNGLVSFWNEVAEHIFGYSKQETIGKVVHEILTPPCYREQYKLAFPAWRVAGQGAAVNKTIELTALRKDGSEIPVELSLASVKIKGMWNAIAVIRDITKRKKAEVEIREMNEELQQRSEQLLAAQGELVRKEKLAVLGQLSGSVSHELRNPLGVMSNAVYFLKSIQSNADENVKEYLDIISQEIENAGRIITDILDFSRNRTPKIMPTEPFLLVTNTLEKCAVPESISLNIDIPNTLPQLKVDPLQMDQVLQNIINNACQAMPNGGSITISARSVQVSEMELRGPEKNIQENGTLDVEPSSNSLEITVTDTGEGISPENMKKLFQPLFTTKVRGIGLGLTICRSFTEANGGRISVESQSGEGTSFKLTLPVEEGAT
ncbi:MAG: PAS domain S-box protein [Pseudomonadota bacterium]